ncbi:LuxR C-terminal-related transcriptional regulator [Eubacterium sp. MSJ-13]|uniref:helix-turn-helix transcriptional regulator n=1 Tax=Eubacterium sp. MSJ-13 TaxID=2841513 RepID=UPI001C10D91D|nr:LuxR C-terminal-related transcriptional regulator [Eubacterium sp. MSJ-13]MBU5478691.1 LuxR C-terminal-related transcriptional regulator [Eubacterium sp. MSJ-13]
MGENMHDENNNIVYFEKQSFERVNLEKIFSEVIDRELIMVIAPSGYGKTTFVRNYFLKRNDIKFIWFAMLREEQDENWVWHRLCIKFSEYYKELSDRILNIDMPHSRQEFLYVARVLNRYIEDELYLVIDDFHQFNNTFFNEMLEVIIDSVEKIHVILISRIYPDISYDEMLLNGKCVILNQQNMTLSRTQVEEIFKENGVVLDEKEADEVYRYTEGWISAVYLALYEYRKSHGFGNFRGANHLLKTAIFDKLHPKIRELYTRMSLFNRFDINGAAFISEVDFSESILLDNIEKFGFVHYDSDTNTFEMHALLRNVAELELEKSQTDTSRIYNRAGELWEKRGIYVKAVKCYIKAKNAEKTAQLYAGEHGKNIIAEAPELFGEIREFIWEKIWEKYPMALLNQLFYLATKESEKKIMPLYDMIMQDINRSEIWSTDNKILGEMQVIKAILQFNDLNEITASLKEACRLLGYQKSDILGNALLTYGTVCMTVLYYNESGKLRQIIEKEKEHTRYYMHLTKGTTEGWDDFFEAEYSMLTGDLKRAYELAESVCKQTLLRKQTCIVISCYYIMFRCLIYSGDKKTFVEKMQELKGLYENETNPLLLTDIDLVRGYTYACLGKEDKMPEWLVDFKLENCSKTVRNIRSGCLTYGKLLCFKKEWEMLDVIAEQMLVPYEYGKISIQPIIAGNIYKAIAKYNLGNEAAAIEYLGNALEIAKPDGFKIAFMENAADIMPVIRQIKKDDFINELMPFMEKYQSGIDSFMREKKNKKPILTKRERELMALVKDGYRNADISEAMHIAVVTVEKNLTNIYRKLGVTNRTAAIRMIKELEEDK